MRKKFGWITGEPRGKYFVHRVELVDVEATVIVATQPVPVACQRAEGHRGRTSPRAVAVEGCRANLGPQVLTLMPDTTAEGQASPEGRAHAAPSPVIGCRRCPVCQKVDLTGRQTACSAACRRERTRQRETAARQARDREIEVLLEAALRKLQEGAP